MYRGGPTGSGEEMEGGGRVRRSLGVDVVTNLCGEGEGGK